MKNADPAWYDMGQDIQYNAKRMRFPSKYGSSLSFFHFM